MVSRLDTTANLALDTQSLAQLRLQAKQSPDQALKAAAQQFESVFLNMMLKSMREATPQDGMLDSEQTKMFTGMLDQQLAQSMSSRGVGLADIMVKQLSRFQKTEAHAGGTPVGAPLLSSDPSADTGQKTENLRSITSHQSSALPSTYSEVGLAGMDGLPPNSQNIQQDFSSGITFAYGEYEPSLKLRFVNRMLPYAMQASRASGVPPQLMLGQAVLESGWGKHEIRMADGSNSYNLFGIKANANWKGKVAEVLTSEYKNGVAYNQVEKFRAYSSYAEAFQDYANMISKNSRYADVLQQNSDTAGMARAIQNAGYAADPKYADKLVRVIGMVKTGV